jgi:hypothetical protein
VSWERRAWCVTLKPELENQDECEGMLKKMAESIGLPLDRLRI